MSRSVHVFDFSDWYAVPDGRGCIDWDCDFHFLVIDGDKISLQPAGSEHCDYRLREQYPDRIMHKTSLSRHRGKLEGGVELLKAHPELHERLGRWCPWK